MILADKKAYLAAAMINCGNILKSNNAAGVGIVIKGLTVNGHRVYLEYCSDSGSFEFKDEFTNKYITINNANLTGEDYNKILWVMIIIFNAGMYESSKGVLGCPMQTLK